MTRTLLLLLIVLAIPSGADAQAVVSLSAPRVAVSPFRYPDDPDYGVFVADRIAAELMQKSYSQALDRKRFVLVEPDPLPEDLPGSIVSAGASLGSDLLPELRRLTRADYLLTGTVEAAGIRTVRARFVDLSDGSVLWSDEIRDDPAWTWTKANANVGDIPAEAIVSSLGFARGDSAPPPPPVDELPENLMIQPVYTTDWTYVAADCRAAIRRGMTRDGVFSLLPGDIRGAEDRVLARVGKVRREQVVETTLADALLCGSLAVTGEAGTIHNLGLTFRIVEVETGLILWTRSTSGRKVWRWDKLSDITASMTGRQLEAIAQFGASNAEDMVADLRENAVDGVSWCVLGEAYLSRGLVDRAQEAFERALTFDDADARALNGLGTVYVRMPEYFSMAIDHFKEAIEKQPDYLEPYTNLASAYLERDMSDGVRYARQAIEKQPTYARPYRILGEYYARNEEDERAVSYLKDYVDLTPDDTETAVILGRSLLRMGDYDAIEATIEPIFQAKPDAFDLIPVLAIKEVRLRNYGAALRLFRAYLSRVTDRERRLYEDIRTVLPAGQVPEFERLDEDARRVYRRRFWRERDPDLTTELNERLLEHYGRVWFARRHFAESAYPWDRRGAVYIRYGEPDYRSRSGRVPALTSPKVQQVKERMYAELYNVPPQGELVGPVFPVRSSRGITLGEREDFASQARGDGFEEDRTQRLSDPQSRLDAESYAPVTLFGDYSIVPWESWVYTDIGSGLVFDFTKEAGGSSGYDFAPIPDIPPRIMRSSARMSEFAPRLAYQRTADERPDAFDEPEYVPIPGLRHEVYDSRSERFRSRVDVTYGIPAASVRSRGTATGRKAILNRSIALADSAYARVFRKSDRVELPLEDGTFVDVVRADLEPGVYHLSLRVHDTISGRLTTVEEDLTVEAYPESALGLSDIVLAASVRDYSGAIPFRRGRWEVRPNPGRVYRRPVVPFYYEIYGLTKDGFGRTHYKVTAGVKHKQGLTRRPAFLAEANPEVSFTFEQSGDQDWERGYLELDLTEARYGTNVLMLSVLDEQTGATVRKRVEFEYLEPGE